MKPKHKKRLKRDIFIAIATFFGMFFIAGCGYIPVSGTVVEKEHKPGGMEYDYSKSKWTYEDECFELDIVNEHDYEHEICVSERVFNDAMLDHQINLTEDYH